MFLRFLLFRPRKGWKTFYVISEKKTFEKLRGLYKEDVGPERVHRTSASRRVIWEPQVLI